MSMKTCNTCFLEKAEELFIKNKKICKDCNNVKRRKQAIEKKKLLEDSTDTKTCKICQHDKLVKEFIVNMCFCKVCYAKKCRESKENKKKELLKQNIKSKQCKTCQVEKVIEQFRAGENICMLCNRDKLYAWRNENKEKFLDCCKRYRSKENVKVYTNEKKKEKYNADENYKQSLLLRNIVRNLINGTTKNPSRRSLELTGCSQQQFKQWIEYNFIDEMNWDNYGDYWNLDHIVPVSSFDLTKEEDMLLCFQWSNTAPEISKKNYEKFNKIDHVKINYFKGRALMFQDKYKYDLIIRERKASFDDEDKEQEQEQ